MTIDLTVTVDGCCGAGVGAAVGMSGFEGRWRRRYGEGRRAPCPGGGTEIGGAGDVIGGGCGERGRVGGVDAGGTGVVVDFGGAWFVFLLWTALVSPPGGSARFKAYMTPSVDMSCWLPRPTSGTH